jgi:transglutaminase-like putative cysteine protease
MEISRRAVLIGATALAAMPARSWAQAASFEPRPGAWRTFELRTTIEVLKPEGLTQAWIPIPAFADDAWIRPGETSISLKGGKAEQVQDPRSGARMVHVTWASPEGAPSIEVGSRVAVRDRSVDPTGMAAGAVTLSEAERTHYTAPTDLIPTDGIVRETALAITAGGGSDLEKARRIYDWIVVNTARDPKTRGCGTGDVAAMLRTGNLSGKCADLNALFVGLARASGLPARDLYGIRLAPSAFGYKSLGANSTTVTKSQHCRAEVFIAGLGWFPVDPADVRKVILEEPPGTLKLGDAPVEAVRKALFGSWETNWLAYNDAHDVALPGSSGPLVPYLMYPQGETAAGRLDPLDPDSFRYSITARSVDV